MAEQDPIGERARRTQWFSEARFGMFIHWGYCAADHHPESLRLTEPPLEATL
jgi:hypothetical protein